MHAHANFHRYVIIYFKGFVSKKPLVRDNFQLILTGCVLVGHSQQLFYECALDMR